MALGAGLLASPGAVASVGVMSTDATVENADCSNVPTGGDTELRAPYLPREAEAALQAEWEAGRRSGDVPRSYLLYVPASVTPGRAPVVMTMHGLLGNARQHLDQTGWAAAAERHGFVVVAPNGRRNWDNSQGGIDEDFLRDVVADVRGRNCVDDRRIYATGHSNGGFMTHRMACENGDLFAAGASYAAGDVENKPQGGACSADGAGVTGWEPVPLGMWHGTDDGIVNYTSGRRGLAGWLERYDCDTPVSRVIEDQFGTTETYTTCARDDVRAREAATGARFELVFRTLDGHGHAWPDGCGGQNAGTGGSVPCDPAGNTRPFPIAADLTEELWGFLSAHTRATPAAPQPPPSPDAPSGPDADDTGRWLGEGVVSGIDSEASFTRIDADGNDVTGTRPTVVAGSLTMRLRFDVRTGGDGAGVGPSHPVCPTENPGPSTQPMPGRTVVLSVTNERTGVASHREVATVLADGVEVAEAVFADVGGHPHDTFALRATFAGTTLKWWWVCGTPPAFYKETVAGCVAHPSPGWGAAGRCLGDPATG